MQERSDDAMATSYARIAGEAYGDTARYLRALPAEEWDGPSGCAEWTVRDLAGHVVGEAVWFPNLARGVTRGEPPWPNDLYASLKTLPPDELTARLTEAARSIPPAIEEATADQLQQTVDLGFTKMPLWQATYVAVAESVYHNWDARAGREPDATIPTAWALRLAWLMGWRGLRP